MASNRPSIVLGDAADGIEMAQHFIGGTPPMASKWPSISLKDAADGIETAQHFIERCCRFCSILLPYEYLR